MRLGARILGRHLRLSNDLLRMGAARKGLLHAEHNRTTTIATRSGMERFGIDYCLTRAAPATFVHPDA